MDFYKCRFSAKFQTTPIIANWCASGDTIWVSLRNLSSSGTPYFMFWDGANYRIHSSPILDFVDNNDTRYTFTENFIDGFPVWSSSQFVLRFSIYLNTWIICSDSVPYKPVQYYDADLADYTSDYGWYQCESSTPQGKFIFEPRGYYRQNRESIQLQTYSEYTAHTTGSMFKFIDSQTHTKVIRIGYQVVQCELLKQHRLPYIVLPENSGSVMDIRSSDTGEIICSFYKSNDSYYTVINGVTWMGSSLPTTSYEGGTVQYQSIDEQGNVTKVFFKSKSQQDQDGVTMGHEVIPCYYGDVALWQ